jgi:hypothetical protein
MSFLGVLARAPEEITNWALSSVAFNFKDIELNLACSVRLTLRAVSSSPK